MRYSKKEKLVISMLLIFGIISLLTLSLTHVITGVFGNKLDLVLNNKIVSRLQIIHVTANYFLFISLICILFCIIKGFVAGCYQKLKNSHGIFLIFFTVLFIILYCPFYFHLLEPNDPDSVVLWYFINFLCISYLFIILMFLENKISSKSGDNKVFSLITHSFEMNIETDKKLYIFSVKELYMLYALSIILIICFVLLSVVLIRLPGIEQHYNNMYYISKHFKYSFLNPGYSIRWIAFICLVILLYLNVNAFWKSSIYHIKKTIIIFLPTIFFMITYITIFWPSSCLAPLTALGWFLIYFLGIFLLIMMIIACRYLNDKVSIIQKEKDSVKRIFILSNKEIKCIIICSSISAIGIMSYMVLRLMSFIEGINFPYIYFRSNNFIFVLWYATFFSILILIYFNIKILKQAKGKKLKSYLRISIYITFLYLIIYIPATQFDLNNVECIIIEIFGCIFFFLFSFYIKNHTKVNQ